MIPELSKVTLSVIIPCYNSQDYMRKAIESVLLPNFEDLEILIINDGSMDNTRQIADEYASANPEIVRAIHQENRGHGGAVNCGIEQATGLYIKVLDSDDWFDNNSFIKVMETLRGFASSEDPVDMLVSNYVYEKQGAWRKKVMRYSSVLTPNRILNWDDLGKFRLGQYFMMHSLIYRTELLRECGLSLPLHTFYVDNLFVSVPLRHVKSIYYINVNLYRYYIGRQDQSVNESVMIRRIDQQLRINKLLLEQIQESPVHSMKLMRYLYHHLEIVTTVSSILLLRSGDEESLRKKDDLWEHIRLCDASMYKRLRKRLLGTLVNLSGSIGRLISISIYGLAQRILGFN